MWCLLVPQALPRVLLALLLLSWAGREGASGCVLGDASRAAVAWVLPAVPQDLGSAPTYGVYAVHRGAMASARVQASSGTWVPGVVL